MGFSYLLAIAEFIGRNWAAIAITATCLALAGWFIAVLVKYTRISLNIFVDTPPPMNMGLMDFKRLEGETVRFRSFDGVSLQGMWLWASPSVEPRGTIVFCHEYGFDLYSCARYARSLLDAGYNIFTFDFRGHGQSLAPTGYKALQWPSDRDVGDLLGATSYVAGCLADKSLPTEIGLFGISRGAGAAILAAESDPNVKAVLCDGAFSTEQVCIAMMKRWAQIFARVRLAYENHPEFFWRLLARLLTLRAQHRMGCKYPSVMKALKRMSPRPIMFIHGRRDSYIPYEQTRTLHAVASHPKQMWLVDDAKHNQSVSVAPGQYARRTLAFFETHLAAGDGEDEVPAETTTPAGKTINAGSP